MSQTGSPGVRICLAILTPAFASLAGQPVVWERTAAPSARVRGPSISVSETSLARTLSSRERAVMRKALMLSSTPVLPRNPIG